MSKVKRYTLVECYNGEEFWAKMKEVKHGDFVLYSDYAELEQQNEYLKTINDGLEYQKAELNRVLKDIILIAENNSAGYYEINEFDEKDNSPEDSIIFDFSVLRKKAVEIINKYK